MNKTIILVSGAKGGVGKSAVCNALAAALAGQNREFSLVDGDITNPDVLRAWVDNDDNLKYNGSSIYGLPLTAPDGWINLVDVAGDANLVVVNLPAGNALLDAAELLTQVMGDASGIDIHLLWVINRQRDSVNLLKETLEKFTPTHITVLKNTYFGASEKFEIFDRSETRAQIEAAGGKVIDFPELSDIVSDRIINERMTLLEAANGSAGGLGQRMEAARFLAASGKVFDACLNS